ncbi:hypothetical protein GAYE_SCF53G6166 [Galdieria yellowstonensis]|uniref:Vesicle transport protein n=1 Tax=Galdieria yellowstonensis TaxID=3028027 RepID=A0AAV9IME7_9RHOD|nr:hypothetical protein GAYE_SCF53G6166 [Galdieria yellowstonensis]
MPKFTLIARQSDALPLAESMIEENEPYGDELGDYKRQAKTLVRQLSKAASPESMMTIDCGYFVYHYVLVEGVIYLTFTEKAYPRRLAFDFLDEISKEFRTVYGSQVERATRPYEFIRFDSFLQKTKKLYENTRTQRNVTKLQQELKDVQHIMTKNIHQVLERGEKLENISFLSSRLVSESKRYVKKTAYMHKLLTYRQYGSVLVVLLIVLVLFWLFN